MPRYVAASESDPLIERTRSPNPSYSERPFRQRPERASPHCCTVCCTILSISASIFLVWIGIYATIGWNYQHGGWTPDQIGTVQRNSFGAAGMWAVTGLISLWFWRRSKQRADELDREIGIMRPHGD